MVKKCKNRPILLLLLIMLAASAISCKGFHTTPVDVPKEFSKTGTEHTSRKWWTALKDERLNSLIETALAENMNLQTTWDRLEQSKAIATKSGADLKPTLDATAGFNQSATKTGGADANFSDLFSLGLSASYELDLWGRLQSTRDAAKLDLAASEEELKAAAISLSAEVATVWYKFVEQQGQITLLNKQIKNHEDYLDIVTMRFRQGQVSSTDVLQQRQTLEAARETKIRFESAVKVLAHQLAVLMGKAPNTVNLARHTDLPVLPPLPDTGLPAEMILKRPDIRSAYKRVRAADTRISTAIANRFPRISLTAGISTSGSTNTGATDLFNNWLTTLAGNLLMPIFDAGSREAEVDRTKAAAKEAFHKYGETILNALKEVEDALSQESFQLERIKSLNKQFELSEKSLGLIRERYTKGATDFLRFINALLGHHGLERSRLTAQRELVEYRINLYRALGGSWMMQRTVPKKRVLKINNRGVPE